MQVREHDDLLLRRGHAGQSAGPVHRRRHHHDDRPGAARRARLPNCPPEPSTALTAQARLQTAPRIDGKPPFEVTDSAAAEPAARPRQGGPVLRLRGRPVVDGRRPRLGPGVPVGRPRGRRRRSGRCGHTTGKASVRRSSISWRWSANAASATRTCTSTTTRPTRRRRCCGWPGATASARTRSTTCCATACSSTCFPLVRKCIRVGAENYSLKSLEPLYMGAELRTGDVTTAADSINAYARYCDLRADGHGDEAADRAQGDRGVQPLRLPIDSPAARLADHDRDRVRRSAAGPAARGRRRRRSRTPTSRPAR